MEAAVCNFLSPGDQALCVVGGRFGQRWGELCRAYGVAATEVEVEWGRPVDPKQVLDALSREPGIKAVYATASETSTGVVHPIREIARICRERDLLCVVDAISAVGAFDVPQDAWGIDVMVSASQKALMVPPGLAFVSASPKAWEAASRAKAPRFYFDLQRMKASQEKGETAWTPAVTLMMGLRESLRMMREEGLPAIFQRHQRLALAARSACAALGCEPFAPEAPSPAVTAAKVPPGVDGSALIRRLRTEYRTTLSGGQNQLQGKIFRLGHMGYVGPLDLLTVVSAIELALSDLGHRCEAGAGVAAAEAALKRI
jgi:aspartate aminotransferase-like enzyme